MDSILPSASRAAEPAPLFDPELLDSIAQGAKRHAPGPWRSGLIVAGLFQRLYDGFALDIYEVISQCGCGGRVSVDGRLGDRKPRCGRN